MKAVRVILSAVWICLSPGLLCGSSATAASNDGPGTNGQVSLLEVMRGELTRDMQTLAKNATATQPAPYFISYDAHDVATTTVLAQAGAILNSGENHQRTVDITIRVGDPKLDNTHGAHRNSAMHTVALPLADDPAALRRALWWGTDTGYGNALRTYLNVETEATVHAREGDRSADFSQQKSIEAVQPAAAAPGTDRAAWETRLRALSLVFRAHPHIVNNLVAMSASVENDAFVSTENSRVAYPHKLARLVVLASTRAEDGSDVLLVNTFEGQEDGELPAQADLLKGVEALATQLDQLRTAPAAEPYDGPALLSGRAAAVFFHEVLGHRLEGQRQKGSAEGETFTKDIGQSILPSFLSVADDPTMVKFGDTYLSGHYEFDDEGEPAQRVALLQQGVLQQFLMSRMPIANFDSSNGHGRAQDGKMPTGRQGNLIVTSTKTVPDAELRKRLIEEVKKQGKPYGLFFADISSGFTLTQRVTPQAFQVIPLVVYRVYADGRPDELVRGVNIVGTPQAALKHILATGDTPAVFNGECGAESGSIPVSAVAPAMLFSEMETQKAGQGNARRPILPPPAAQPLVQSSIQPSIQSSIQAAIQEAR